MIRHKVGKPGPCATQELAHCLVADAPVFMNRQRLCARTAENCQRRREWYLKNKPSDIDHIGPCNPTRNVVDVPFGAERSPAVTP